MLISRSQQPGRFLDRNLFDQPLEPEPVETPQLQMPGMRKFIDMREL